MKKIKMIIFGALFLSTLVSPLVNGNIHIFNGGTVTPMSTDYPEAG